MRPIVLDILVLIVSIPLGSLVHGSEGARPTNCLIILNADAINTIEKLSVIDSLIQKHGGSVRHVFWPSALFAYVKEGAESPLEDHPLITRLIRSEVSPPEAQYTGLPSYVVAIPGELFGTPRPSRVRLLWDGKHRFCRACRLASPTFLPGPTRVRNRAHGLGCFWLTQQ